MKRFASLALVLAMCFSIACVPASAAEQEGPVYEIMSVYDAQTRAKDTPSEFYNLGGDNYYEGSLIDLAATKGSYTKYYFATGTGKIYIKMDLERSGTTTNKERSLEIRLYEKSSATATGTLFDTRTVSFNTAEATKRVVFTGLDSNKFYYVYFYNTSGNSTGSSLDVSCTAIIDDSYN